MSFLRYLSAFIDLTIIIVGIFFSIQRYKKHRRIDLFLLTNISICLYYGVAPFLIKIYKFDYETQFLKTLEFIDDSKFFSVSLLCLSLYLVFILINIKKFKNIRIMSSAEITKNINEYYKIYTAIAYFSLIVGSISYLLISSSVGGPLQLLRIGEKARAYGQGAGAYIDSEILPIRSLMPIILVAPFIFLIMKKIKNNVLNNLMFILSFILSILFMIFNAGRVIILTFLLPFIIKVLFKYKHRWIYIISLSIILIPFLKILDELFFYLSYGYTKNIGYIFNPIGYFIEQFGYPYINLLNAENMINDIGIRYGVDCFNWLINIVPVSILSKFGMYKIQSLNDHITLFYSDIKELSKITGGVPVDAFTFGYLQFRMVGAFIFVSFFSLLTAYLDKIMYNDKEYYIKEESYLRIILTISFLVPNIAPESIIRGRLDIIILTLLFILTGRKFMANKTEWAKKKSKFNDDSIPINIGLIK